LLQWDFDCEQIVELNLLVAKLVVGLVAGASSQLGSLSIKTISGLEIGKTV